VTQPTWGYTIRQASVDDARAIAKVHVESWQSSYRHILPDELLSGLSVEGRAQGWARSLTEPRHVTFVGTTREGRVVGFCDAGPNRSEPKTFEGEIYALYLVDEAKRQGVGRALFQAAATWLTQNELPSLIVWVLAANVAARHFYERLGGRLVAEKSISISGAPYREVAYSWI